MKAWLHVVGIGAEGLPGLGDDSRRLIAQAEVLIGSRRHLDLVPADDRLRLRWQNPLTSTFEEIEAHRGQSCVVLASGDPLWYGVGTQLIARFGAEVVAVHPTISSMQFACARLGWNMQDIKVVSLHGRSINALRLHLHGGRKLLILSGPESQAGDVARFLDEIGCPNSRLTVLERLGAADERITRFDGTPHDPLAILALEIESARGLLRHWLGMPDDAFEHDGKITKRELRAMAIAKLAQAPGLLWDIGAGSGAIGVEWLVSGAGTAAVAVERDHERLAVIHRNVERFGLSALEIRGGQAPECLSDLPDPDAIFIGGGLGNPDLLKTCLKRLPRHGCLVAHAVTLESERNLLEAHACHGGELIRIGIDRADPVGSRHGWRPAMPVLQYAWRDA